MKAHTNNSSDSTQKGDKALAPKAIIIGATSGIGKALAIEMAKQGYELGLTGRREELLQKLSDSLPHKSTISSFDVSKTEMAINALKQLIDQMGGVNIVVINAGIGSEQNWIEEKQTVDVNVLGFTAMARTAFDYFSQAKRPGQIIGISSVLALLATGQAPAYSASKSYVSAYIKGLQRQANQQKLPIVCTDIKPGFVETPMTEKNPTMFWVAPVEKAAKQILHTIQSKKHHAYITRRWATIGLLMKVLPDFLFKKF